MATADLRAARALLRTREPGPSWECRQLKRRRVALRPSLPADEAWTVRRRVEEAPAVRVDLGPVEDEVRRGAAAVSGFVFAVTLGLTVTGSAVSVAQLHPPCTPCPADLVALVRAALRRLIEDAEVLGRPPGRGKQLELFGGPNGR